MTTIKCVRSPGDSLSSNIVVLHDLLTKINSIPVSEKEIVFDLSEFKWSTPLIITTLSCAIGSLIIANKKVSLILPDNENCKRYLLSIGLMNIAEGKWEKPTKPRSYLPIVSIDNDNSERSLKLRTTVLTELNQMLRTKLGIAGVIENAALYMLDELTDNISEHSLANKGWFCAQHYPSKNFFDLSIVDDGITVGGCFRSNGLDYDDLSSLTKALSGKSTKKEDRGFGLSSTRNLLTNSDKLGSEMLIISGKAGVLITSTTKYKIDCSNWPSQGTIINLRVPLRTDITNSDFIESLG